MSRHRLSSILLLAALVQVAGFASLAAAPVSAWVQLAPGGAEIRAIAAGSVCPNATIDGRPEPMQLRAAPDAAFPLATCRLVLPAGTREAAIDGRILPLLKRPPRRILIFGDTGCRVKGELVQDCNNPHAWPFAAVVRLAAAHNPDLVLHVGDYYYRETACPADAKGCAGSPHGDNWRTWNAEFFTPASPLLAAAPWVFVRGNHESCNRGGPGWFRLLDAAPSRLTCPAVSAPFKIDLGDLNLYVLDSADTEDRRAAPGPVAAFSAQLSALAPDLARHPGWIVTHRPIWGLTPIARLGPIGPFEVALNETEQAAVRGRDLSAVQMIVSGHIHHFAAFSFGARRPAQLIAGTGGDIGEDADTPAVRTGEGQIDGMTATSLSFDRFGYLLLDRAGGDWVGAFHDLDDRVVATCRLHARQLNCIPPRR